MKLILPIRMPVSSRSRTPILGALIAALAGLAGASGLVYPSSYSPLLFLGGIVAIVTFIVWLTEPVWALYAALFVIFLPLGLAPANIQSILSRSMTVIALGVWLVRLLRTRRIVWTAPALLMLCFLGWSGVTLLWAQNLGTGLTTLQMYLLRFLLFLFLIPNEIRTKRDLDGLMKTLALSGWVLMLSVISTLFLEGYTAGSRFKVLGVNENEAGMLAMITMVGVLWQVSQPSKHDRTLKVLMAAVFVLLTFGLVAMSGSRGGAITLMVTLGAFSAWKSTRPWGRFGFLTTILALIFVPQLLTTLFERFAVERSDTLLGGREALWQAAWQLVSDHPLRGVGIGNVPYAVVPYLETDPRLAGLQSVSVHNPVLTIWGEMGLLGMLFYLGVLISALFSFGKQYLKCKELISCHLAPYFALISSVFLGYMASWIKGGGMQTDFSFFLLLALLLIPSGLDANEVLGVDNL